MDQRRRTGSEHARKTAGPEFWFGDMLSDRHAESRIERIDREGFMQGACIDDAKFDAVIDTRVADSMCSVGDDHFPRTAVEQHAGGLATGIAADLKHALAAQVAPGVQEFDVMAAVVH